MEKTQVYNGEYIVWNGENGIGINGTIFLWQYDRLYYKNEEGEWVRALKALTFTHPKNYKSIIIIVIFIYCIYKIIK